MDYEEYMIEYILHHATKEEIDAFFGGAEYELTKECCEDNLAQMPDDIFDALYIRFNLPLDVKL